MKGGQKKLITNKIIILKQLLSIKNKILLSMEQLSSLKIFVVHRIQSFSFERLASPELLSKCGSPSICIAPFSLLTLADFKFGRYGINISNAFLLRYFTSWSCWFIYSWLFSKETYTYKDFIKTTSSTLYLNDFLSVWQPNGNNKFGDKNIGNVFQDFVLRFKHIPPISD